MKLLVQPGDGVTPLTKAMSQAKHSIEIVIFRFDEREVERALASAVSRGLSVHALIAHTNRSGEENLRKLEMRLLAAGVTVARTADDLVRYHSKLILIDRKELFVLAFNFTHQDIDRSRSFALATTNRDLVREAGRLFDADVKRHPYEACSDDFIVSPVNARKKLSAFIKGALKELFIYDPEVSDPAICDLLDARAKAGVDVRIIGKYNRKNPQIPTRKLALRLHTRGMIRDGKAGFLGSQSLRELELDKRREVGVIFRDAKIVSRLREVFLDDWEHTDAAARTSVDLPGAAKVAKKVAKAVAGELPPVTPVVDEVVRQMTNGAVVEIDPAEMESIVKAAVKDAVREAVEDAVGAAVEPKPEGGK